MAPGTRRRRASLRARPGYTVLGWRVTDIGETVTRLECLFVTLLRPGHETRIHHFRQCGARLDALSKGYGGLVSANDAVFLRQRWRNLRARGGDTWPRSDGRRAAQRPRAHRPESHRPPEGRRPANATTQSGLTVSHPMVGARCPGPGWARAVERHRLAGVGGAGEPRRGRVRGPRRLAGAPRGRRGPRLRRG